VPVSILVMMQLTGHKSGFISDRCSIVSPEISKGSLGGTRLTCNHILLLDLPLFSHFDLNPDCINLYNFLYILIQIFLDKRGEES
jgi:hypothetical protein